MNNIICIIMKKDLQSLKIEKPKAGKVIIKLPSKPNEYMYLQMLGRGLRITEKPKLDHLIN